MKNKLIPFIILLSYIIIFANCNYAFSEWKDLDKIKVAIIELSSRVPGENIDTATITDLLQAELVNQKSFMIVERTLIDKILDEQKFQFSGLTNAQLVKIGELSGAQKIIIGSVSKLGDEYLILVKAIDASTGVVDFSEKISNKSMNGLINDMPDLTARIVQRAKGEAQPEEKPIENKDQEASGADTPAMMEIIAPYSVIGDKIYSYPNNKYCYLSQEITVDSFMILDQYAGINFYLYDNYEEGQPEEIPRDIRQYTGLHLEFQSDHSGLFSVTLNQDYTDRMSEVELNYKGDGFNSYDLPLTSFKAGTGIKAADLKKIKTISLCPQFFARCQYRIRNIYLYNSKSRETHRIAMTYHYTWTNDQRSTINASARILEAELDYDPDSNVTGLGVICNSNPHDYRSTINLAGYQKLIFELKADATKVDVAIDAGTTYQLTGVSSTYSTFTVPLDKIQDPVLYLNYSREIDFQPVSSRAGALYVRNIRFE